MSSLKDFHPFGSTLLSIIIGDRQGINGGINSLNLLRKDQSLDCEFHRIEFNESMFDIFPSGVLFVKDQRDILSRLIAGGMDYIKFVFEEGDPVVVHIHSAQHASNAASRDEESYIAIHFSIAFYQFAQETTMSKIMEEYEKPKVFRIDNFINELVDKVNATDVENTSVLNGMGPYLEYDSDLVDITDNYIVYRPLNPKLDGTEVSSDSVADYLNYISNYAVPHKDGPYGNDNLKGKPRFFCWIDWGKHVNFRYFYDRDTAESKPINFRYAIINSDAAKVKIGNAEYSKVYNYSTNQGGQYITKEYYYIRKTPKVLDYNHPEDENEYQHLNYQFQDSGEKFNVEIISTEKNDFGTFNTMIAGSQELKYPGVWGYIDGSKLESKESVESHIGGVLGYKGEYSKMNFAGFTTSFNYYDHSEMWKNMFDLTPVDPFYSGGEYYLDSSVNTNNSKLQKVIDIRWNSLLDEKQKPEKSQLELIRKVEVQNFVLYSLCCMGEEQEQSFFAKLHSFVYGTTYDIQPRTERNWLYTWTKIVPDIRRKEDDGEILNQPAGLTFTDYDIKHLRGWTYDFSETSGLTFDDENVYKFAININEKGNTGSINAPDSYFNPGWAKPSGNLKYRPIGVQGNATKFIGDQAATNGYTGPVNQIVRMYKKSWISLLGEAGVTLIDPGYIGKYLYYFSSENVLDGPC